MRDASNPIGPLERAILDLLCSLPLRWERFDTDWLTGTEQEAIKRLARGGLVEQRIRLRARMDGFPQALHMQVCVSGEYRAVDVISQVFSAVPEWLDGKGQTRGRFRLESDGVVEARLTDQGAEARHDYEHNSPQNPSFILAFVLGVGPMGIPRPQVKGTVRVESYRVDSADVAEPQGVAMRDDARRPVAPAGTRSQIVASTAPSQATAAVGDIAVHNHIHIDQGAIVDTVLKKLTEQQAATPARGLEKEPPARSTAPAAPEVAKEKNEKSSRAQWPLERIEVEVRNHLQQHKAMYRKLGQACLDGRAGADAEFRSVFGPTPIAIAINETLGITDPAAQCSKQDVSRTRTYQAFVRPLVANPPRRPEAWATPNETDAGFQDILGDIQGDEEP
jgi:hypothetical protein